MASQTTKGYPYPDPGDPIRNGADAIKALAQKIETELGWGIVSGRTTVTISAAATVFSAAVTFPAGSFPFDPPNVVVTPDATAPQNIFATANNVSATGFTISAYRNTGTANITVHWHAHV